MPATKPKINLKALQRPAKLSAKQQMHAEMRQLLKQIDELRVQYEQYFIDLLPQPPTKLQAETVRLIRKLLKAPFKTSADRYHLRTMVTRYQTYHTYWERVLKAREEGKYSKDVFRADLRDRLLEDAKKEASREGKADKSMKQLYNTYEEAARKVGLSGDKMNYDSFKKSLLSTAKQLKSKHGVQRLHYKVVVRDGKVVIKASAK